MLCGCDVMEISLFEAVMMAWRSCELPRMLCGLEYLVAKRLATNETSWLIHEYQNAYHGVASNSSNGAAV